MTRRDRDDLHIDIFVSREPGSLSVQSYSDSDSQTLTHVIAEAERFIAGCRAIQQGIETHGLGERIPRSQADKDAAAAAVDAWESVVGPGDFSALFGNSPLFTRLK